MQGSLLDADLVKGKIIRLIVKSSGRTERFYDDSFKPYFYFDGEKPKDFESERVERLIHGKKKGLWKVYCNAPGDVPAASEALKSKGQCFEFKIPFYRRYLIDKGLVPCDGVEVEFEERKGRKFVKKIKRVDGIEFKPKIVSLDIETYNERGFSNAMRDPCLMVGYADEGGAGLLEHGKRGFATEKEMLEALGGLLKEKRADIVFTYNGDEFDLPYLQERAKKVNARMHLGRDRSAVKVKRLGMRNRARLGGRVHLDVYDEIFFLNYIGAVRLERLRLEDVYKSLLGKEKQEVKKEDIWKLWKAGDAILGEYCKGDALSCFELGEYAMPLEVELARITGSTLFDASRSTAGQHVEALLLRESFNEGEIVPNKPGYAQVKGRSENPIEGAFVKVPEPGVYENIAVFDFRSLYPTIIISHNVDPTTLNCDCCKDAFESPNGHRFCKKRKGLIPKVLGKVLKTRFKIKDAEKEAKGREKAGLHARQWALKIIANSFYGYTAYARSRYYSRECAESITAWARHYIKDTIAKAEEEGFNVLYGDTDSLFFTFEKGKEAGLEAFREKVNAKLPGNMELELEGIFPRGIFVSKKSGGKGAKKKYALMGSDGKIKIRGFELVRRDWSRIARRTQKRVLEILLKEGDAAKAADFVRGIINDLKGGKVELQDLAVLTSLRKKTSEYLIKSPELRAVLEARKAGLDVPEGAMVEYLITKKVASISD